MLARTDQLTIRAWYGQMPTERLARQIRKPVEVIEAEAVRLGLRRPIPSKEKAMQVAEDKAEKQMKPPHKYTPSRMDEVQVERLVEKYATTDTKQLAHDLGLSWRYLVNTAHRLGLSKAPRPRRVSPKRVRRDLWTAEQDALMVELYPHQTTASLVPIIGKSAAAIGLRAARLKLNKTTQCLSETRHQVMTNQKQLIAKMSRAREHLRTGDHMTALNILEEALA